MLDGLEAAHSGAGMLQARFTLAVPPGADSSFRLGCMCAHGPASLPPEQCLPCSVTPLACGITKRHYTNIGRKNSY